MTESPAVSLSFCLMPTNNANRRPLLCQEIEGLERIYVHIEAVSYLLNPYEKYDAI